LPLPAKIHRFVNLYKVFDADDEELTSTSKLQESLCGKAVQGYRQRPLLGCGRPSTWTRPSPMKTDGNSGSRPTFGYKMLSKRRGRFSHGTFFDDPRYRDHGRRHLRAGGPRLGADLQMLRRVEPGDGRADPDRRLCPWLLHHGRAVSILALWER
jgi:hypothetical protein